MPASRTEQIILAIVTTLNGDGLPADVTVDRFRRQALTVDDLPRISVYPRDEEVSRATQNRTSAASDRKLRVAIVARVQGTDDALDPLRQWIVAAMLADPSLGGLALSVDEEASDWELDEDSEGDFSVSATTFSIRYVTRRNDLTAA